MEVVEDLEEEEEEEEEDEVCLSAHHINIARSRHAR